MTKVEKSADITPLFNKVESDGINKRQSNYTRQWIINRTKKGGRLK